MTAIAVPPPIPGRTMDPPPKETPKAVAKLEARDDAAGTAAGVGYRAINRYTYAKAGLLAAGTTYYLFLATFSIVAFGYGVAALLGADRMADLLTEAVTEAFPGLVGDEGIDPEALTAVGRATSIVGLVALLWAGGGAMVAASRSLRQIYGAGPDPRNYLLARLRLLGWMLGLLPLVAASYAASTALTSFAGPVLDWLGLESTFSRVVVVVVTVVATLALDFLVLYLLFSNLGGIRPEVRARRVGAGVGALLIEILKYFMALIIGFSVAKPQYGALAAPIGILLVLYLQCIATYGAAALVAGVAERDVPLEELTPAGATAA